MPRSSRILLYAVNHVGLGHAVRLSILQKRLQREHGAACRFFTDSDHVSGLFSCPGHEAAVPRAASMRERIEIIDRQFRRALEIEQPHTVVCDTYWPQHPIEHLRRAGVRTILMLRLLNPTLMSARVRRALVAFDTVMLPHHPAELRWTFRAHRQVLDYLGSQSIGCVGPIARQATARRSGERVIFTVGGGGDWPGAGHANRIRTYLDTFFDVAGQLMQRGHPKPAFAVGPLLELDRRFRSRFHLIRTTELYRHFGDGSVVISRGGYNTCWEAIAAGSRLVLCGSHRSEEDVDARCRFLDRERLGRRVALSVVALVQAIERPWAEVEQHATMVWSPVVNAGLPLVVSELMDQRFLRASEP